MCLHGISGDLQSWLEPQQGTNLSAFIGGIFGVNKKCPVLLPQFCRQKSPGLPSTSSTPLQQLESGEEMWLLPKHSLLLLLSTHSVENNPNSSVRISGHTG